MLYNESITAKKMNEFMKYDFNISVISLAIYVEPGTGDAIHNNRRFHGIMYNCGGIKKYVFDNNKTIIIKEKEMIYLPKHSNYIVENVINGGCYAINFDLSEKITFDSFAFRPKNPQNFSELFKDAENTWRLKRRGYHMKCKADLYSILYSLQKEYRMEYISKGKADFIRPAIQYIEENYTGEVISISQLASLCKMSDVYFRNLFFKSYGISPLKYINGLKIARAKELILSGFYSIHEVAELSGFHDDCYFSREFKKQTGSTPKAFKNR